MTELVSPQELGSDRLPQRLPGALVTMTSVRYPGPGPGDVASRTKPTDAGKRARAAVAGGSHLGLLVKIRCHTAHPCRHGVAHVAGALSKLGGALRQFVVVLSV